MAKKIQPPEQGARAIQTDGRATTYSEREHQFTFAKTAELIEKPFGLWV